MNIKKINEFLKPDDYLVEMAHININDGFKYVVFVNGGNSYGKGRNEHGDPHFHFTDKTKGSNFQLSILIPTVEEWSQNKELYISETSNGDYSWNGLIKEKKDLLIWLDKSNTMVNVLTNLEVIRQQWNILNIDNKNVKQIKRIS